MRAALYARVSSADQEPANQLADLAVLGVAWSDYQTLGDKAGPNSLALLDSGN